MPEQFTLKRSGNSPLSFSGELLAEQGGKWHAGREINRWYDLCLYRTDAGTYVALAEYRTQWQGESDWSDVFASKMPGEINNWLHSYNPLAHVAGYPAGEAYADRQAKLERQLVEIYQYRLGELLADADHDLFAEKIE